MPHFPKPLYRPSRRLWYVEIDKRQHPLGKHPEGVPPPKKLKGEWRPVPRDVWEEYQRLAAGAPELPAPENEPSHPFVSVIVDDFTGWLRGRVAEGSKAARTLDWYSDYLTSFLAFLGGEERAEVPSLTIDALTPDHVYRWVDAHPDWKTGKRGAMVAVQRCFNWAAKAGKLKTLGARSPLQGLEKPAQGCREKLVTEDEYRELLGLVKDRFFGDLLELSWNTGARPHELFTVEARFVDHANGCWVFPVKLSKGKKVQRVVYLNDRALEITRRLVAQHPHGPLLLNTEGRPWRRLARKRCCQRPMVRVEQNRTAAMAAQGWPSASRRMMWARRRSWGREEGER